ncbi:two-component system nitrogen regulation sensor histidine kinase GlnL [Thioalkalivibrio sp. ALE21]|uniref:nitrogen regulation protein NR(II) n=1 Tax=Thioalkalivibrio sp. ALE21 TaxID=1158175 RepID=UPI000D8E162D|nr:nitrogen regulation protein NR(II) [Thioalkalivibrio sp. ALE21]PYG03595.1 two-component system nitrogen regulation sensor histidine kinase GlnL [Thioalkalivibrio sp. ALE21]
MSPHTPRPSPPLPTPPWWDDLSTAVMVTDGELRLQAMNGSAEVLLGLSRERILGHPLGHWLHLDRNLSTRLRSALVQDQPITLRARQMEPLRAESFLADVIITPLQGEGDEPGRLLFELSAIDRHERISREEQLQKQQAISRAVTRGLAHEIKNPLGGLRGAAQLLAGELDDPDLREYTRIIIHEADRLRALVDRMLGPNNMPQRTSVNLHEILEHVRGLISVQLPLGVKIRGDYDPSIPEIKADRDMLVQALLNLVQNALQALGDEGEIVLSSRILRQYTVSGKRHRLVARLSVRDNGPGIPEEVRERIFFPMITGRASGTGLGLPIAQSLVQLHDGLIECHSRPGSTRFDILLPVAGPPASESPEA